MIQQNCAVSLKLKPRAVSNARVPFMTSQRERAFTVVRKCRHPELRIKQPDFQQKASMHTWDKIGSRNPCDAKTHVA